MHVISLLRTLGRGSSILRRAELLCEAHDISIVQRGNTSRRLGRDLSDSCADTAVVSKVRPHSLIRVHGNTRHGQSERARALCEAHEQALGGALFRPGISKHLEFTHRSPSYSSSPGRRITVLAKPMFLMFSSSWPFIFGYANQLDAFAPFDETRMACCELHVGHAQSPLRPPWPCSPAQCSGRGQSPSAPRQSRRRRA